MFLDKPLKRLTTFPSRPNPKLKLGENERLSFARALKHIGHRNPFRNIPDLRYYELASHCPRLVMPTSSLPARVSNLVSLTNPTMIRVEAKSQRQNQETTPGRSLIVALTLLVLELPSHCTVHANCHTNTATRTTTSDLASSIVYSNAGTNAALVRRTGCSGRNVVWKSRRLAT